MMNTLVMLRKNVFDGCQRAFLLLFRTYTPHAICTQVTSLRNERPKNGFSSFTQFGIQVYNSIGSLELPHASGKLTSLKIVINRRLDIPAGKRQTRCNRPLNRGELRAFFTILQLP